MGLGQSQTLWSRQNGHFSIKKRISTQETGLLLWILDKKLHELCKIDIFGIFECSRIFDVCFLKNTDFSMRSVPINNVSVFLTEKLFRIGC